MKQSLKDYEMSVKETSKKIALYEEEEKNLKTKNVALEKVRIQIEIYMQDI